MELSQSDKDNIAWRESILERMRTARNTVTCKLCGESIRWIPDGIRLSGIRKGKTKWKALNIDGNPHGMCRPRMGIIRQWTYKKKT